MVEQLKSKTSCISVICVCLINTPQFTLMVRLRAQHFIHSPVKKNIWHSTTVSLLSHQPSDVLPCSPDDIVTAVLSVLKLCSGMSTSAGAGELCRNIMHCGRVQKCALEALTALSSSPGKRVGQQKVTSVEENAVFVFVFVLGAKHLACLLLLVCFRSKAEDCWCVNCSDTLFG